MKLHLPAGTLAAGPYETVVTPESAGWDYSALWTAELPPGGAHAFDTGEFEMLVLPLAGGSFTVTCDGETFELRGRRDVFSRVTDFAYVPRGARVTVRDNGRGGRFALPAARCRRRLAARYVPAEEVRVELRGAGPASRQVVNFCTPDAFPHADRLIACEVLTPGGCWSSYPPHKHDEERAGECVLEEIYYFAVRAGRSAGVGRGGRRGGLVGNSRSGKKGGQGYLRVYGSSDPSIDVLAEVRSGDVVLVPHGWHGPAMAPPGYDLYYLNVMAGPAAERAWRICDDPAHAWVRETWAAQELDPRLPLISVEERT